MRPNLAEPPLMTIEDFLEFCEGRPDDERWELIEGVAVMSASPVQVHQLIVSNIVAALRMEKIAQGATWIPMVGVGTRVPSSPNSLPQPDAYVQAGPVADDPVTGDAIVLFEVLSKSNTKADQAWRQKVYASVPNCQHYVTVATKSIAVVRYDRSNSWKGTEIKGIKDALDFTALHVALPLAEIYRWTPLAG